MRVILLAVAVCGAASLLVAEDRPGDASKKEGAIAEASAELQVSRKGRMGFRVQVGSLFAVW